MILPSVTATDTDVSSYFIFRNDAEKHYYLVVWGMHEEDAICDFFKAAAHLIFVSFFSVESSR